MPKADPTKRGLGKSPEFLNKLDPYEIQKAGEEGIDQITWLRGTGCPEKFIAKVVLYPKWTENYNKGRALFDMAIQRQINEAAKNGDTQILKLLKSKQDEDTDDGAKVIVTIRGKNYLK